VTITIPPTCILGTRHRKAVSSEDDSRRPLWQRRDHLIEPLRSGWDIGELVDNLLRQGFTSVHLVGDSVSIQMGHFLSCDAIRSRGVSVEEAEFEGAKPKHHQCRNMYLNDRKGGCDTIVRPGVGKLTVTSARWELKCFGSKCLDLQKGVRKDVVKQILSTLRRQGVNRQRLLVIFNYGLHFSKPRHKLYPELESFREDVIAGLASGLVEVASKLKARNNSQLVFRETSSQHFTWTPDGSYTLPFTQHRDRVPHPPYCSKAKVPLTEYPTDASLRRHLAQNVSRAGNVVWQEFYKLSQLAVNLHTEMKKSDFDDGFHVDCTHYIYVPFYFSGLVFRSLATLLHGMF
jgi:hypothetical protein